jgi:hypothetical protein
VTDVDFAPFSREHQGPHAVAIMTVECQVQF